HTKGKQRQMGALGALPKAPLITPRPSWPPLGQVAPGELYSRQRFRVEDLAIDRRPPGRQPLLDRRRGRDLERSVRQNAGGSARGCAQGLSRSAAGGSSIAYPRPRPAADLRGNLRPAADPGRPRQREGGPDGSL